jgi:hypothetical protein
MSRRLKCKQVSLNHISVTCLIDLLVLRPHRVAWPLPPLMHFAANWGASLSSSCCRACKAHGRVAAFLENAGLKQKEFVRHVSCH